MVRTPKPISARSTIAHVAERAGVSTATVSRVLNGNYPVSKEARAKVAQAIDEIDFVQNAQAKALVQAKTGIVGVVMADVSDPFYSEMIGSIQNVCGANGKLLVICSTQGHSDVELSYLQVLRSQRVDAVIVLGGGSDDDQVQASLARQAAALAREGCRLVLCGRPAPDAGRDTLAVEVDNVDAARQATRHLMAFGHREILFLGGPRGSTTSRDRLAGFRFAFDEAGWASEQCTVDAGDFSRQAGYDLAKKHVLGGTRFTAILAASDFMAIGAIRALLSMGLRIPDDLSLIGIDDIPSASDMVPRLSTVRLPLSEMGRLAAGLALGLDRTAPLRPLGVSLVPGLTVGPLPASGEALIGRIAG
ncbi:LacI family DNA-binding transcriptional regulator [Lichenifustis flavocetrariae]|uniref:LacI family transcriptional regulator n=1 Tax=Lichenifustis flavocetrariae TaxID=2949735 RepID=A0AA42CRW0_9HYPH|nr:LacI family DNA-binding transcriptional regulator [Lichenifustis flavocetrariae]MCW6512887.1 LacI family transcriptional regulator [Lichenifustis flavocetrariae]